MKKVISLLLFFCMLSGVITALGANEIPLDKEITITINGDYLICDSAPYIKNDRTLVPMRAIFEALGATVSWNNDTRTAIGVKDNVEVEITIGENVLYKNGEAIIIDCAAEITNDRTMVPVRAISEAFCATVSWDNDNRVVEILTDKEIKIIRIGTHSIVDEDPRHSQTTMSEKEKEAALFALNKVKTVLGADIQFVQYLSADYTTELSESVEKGEPLCELTVLWNGSQKRAVETDLIQPIDDYVDIFCGENFPLEPKAEGHYYFMQRDFMFMTTWPIVYNITMLDKIPELKEEDGTTLYPAELYYRGEWTWSGFEKYMEIVKNHCEKYSGYYAPVPFETNYTFFAEQALHSVGASIYDGESINAGGDNALKAIEFAGSLFEKGLVSCETAEKNATNSGFITSAGAFTSGVTYFTNCPIWKIDEAAGVGSLGVVPFPYPDGEKDGYSHSNHGGDSVGLVKGIDKETAELAIKAYKMYKVEYYKALANVESMEEFADKYAKTDAEMRGIDVTHPEVGEFHAKIWAEYGKTPVNEYSEAFGVFWKWSGAFGEYAFSDLGIDGYKEAIEAMK